MVSKITKIFGTGLGFVLFWTFCVKVKLFFCYHICSLRCRDATFPYSVIYAYSETYIRKDQFIDH